MLLFAFVALAVVLLYLSGTKVDTTVPEQREREEKKVVTKKKLSGLMNYVPEAAADYCIDLWKLYNFTLNIKGNRKTKLGDFRVDRVGEKVSISVNGTLNPYAFLVTYLHEVAHLRTWQEHRAKVKPHGEEWQNHFRLLMQPMLTSEIFPPEVLKPLKKYMQSPAASTASCQPLWIALRTFDESTDENTLLLAHIADGDKFRFSDTVYQKVEMRRTRALCQNLSNGRRYLISKAAQVELVA